MNKKIAAYCLFFIAILLVWVLRTAPFEQIRGSSDAAEKVTGRGTKTEAPANPEKAEGSAPIPVADANRQAGAGGGPVQPGPPALPAPSQPGSNRVAPAAGASGPEGETIAEILKDKDMTDPKTRAWVVARVSELEEAKQEAANAKAARLGIPLRIVGPGGQISEIYDFVGDKPLYRRTHNQNSAISGAVNPLYPASYSLSGTGIRVGVWDGGSVRATHQELSGRVTLKNGSAAIADHATHVAGTIGASGVQAAAKGMAPLVKIDSYDWDTYNAEMLSAGMASATDTSRLPLSNHSYGYELTIFDAGRYSSLSRNLDATAFSLPYFLSFWSAGNDQSFTASGYQTISNTSLAKNVVTVGAVNDAVSGGVRSLAGATITTFSSEGPCDDGRIKPDLVANGYSLYSSGGADNADYYYSSGTSMSSPSATGAAALVTQLYNREFSGQRMRASTLKALLIHTADDLGTAGPDYRFGWGLINAKAAADLVLANKASLASPKINENSVTDVQNIRTHAYVWDGTSPIRATLCWTDPAGAMEATSDSRTPNLVHNLDLTVTAPNGTTIYRPYVMPFVGSWTQGSITLAAVTGKNNVDNVEQVYIPTPTQAGLYTVTVSLDGALTTSSQSYSLVVTGGTNIAANPPPSVDLTEPAEGSSYLPGDPISLAATASDTVAGGGPGTVSQVEFRSGSTTINTDPSAPYAFNWTAPSPGTYSLTARATDSQNATTLSTPVPIFVLSGDGTPTLSSLAPESGRVAAAVVLNGGNFAGVTAVRFNGVDCLSYTVDSLTRITAVVPSAATTGPVTVVTTRGSVTSAEDFTVLEPAIVISQVYGGGGQAGSALNADYVELYNRSSAPVSLGGWSLQYSSASGLNWSTVNLAGTMPVGGYYLVQLATGGTGGPLPAADATGTISMSATSGKVALRSSTAPFTTSSPIEEAAVEDLVGYGLANAFEGSAAAPSPSSTTAIFRLGNGATDTGDNAADFVAGPPNPRNAAGIPMSPAIIDATAATGTVGVPFSYQIVAANGPVSYGATNLPAGLSVNPSTGLVSGTPTAAGTTNATLTATNASGTGSATLGITINAAGGGILKTVFSENMGSPSGTTTIAANTFQNSSLSFSGTATVENSTVSSGYTGASGNGNILIGIGTTKYFEISGINTQGYTGLQLSFGHYKSTTSASNELVVEVSADGTNYSPLSYTRATGTGTATWLLVQPTGTIVSTANLRIRFRQTATLGTHTFRVDDVKLTGTYSASPAITATGAPDEVTTTYGTASPTPGTFTVSGVDLSAGILVTPPPGFEISQTAGGASGYAATQTVGTSGTIPETTLYTRLAAGLPVASYTGNFVCTSAGAATVNVTATASDVRKKVLTITASDRSKAFGATLNLGNSAFTSSGLVGLETIGSVTLGASGGTGQYDAQGAYAIVPSNATGGTFNPDNYDLSYVPGVLSVTGQSFAAWMNGTYSGNNALPGADPDRNGLSNLQEYFYGLAPGYALAGGRLKMNVAGNQLTLEYRRSKSAVGVNGAAQWSNALGASESWLSTGIVDTLVSDEGDYEIRKAVLTLQPGDTRKFFRMNVTQP